MQFSRIATRLADLTEWTSRTLAALRRWRVDVRRRSEDEWSRREVWARVNWARWDIYAYGQRIPETEGYTSFKL